MKHDKLTIFLPLSFYIFIFFFSVSPNGIYLVVMRLDFANLTKKRRENAIISTNTKPLGSEQSDRVISLLCFGFHVLLCAEPKPFYFIGFWLWCNRSAFCMYLLNAFFFNFFLHLSLLSSLCCDVFVEGHRPAFAKHNYVSLSSPLLAYVSVFSAC